VRFAAQSTCESSLDAYNLRKGDERFEMTPDNYHLCSHYHKSNIIQKRFESWWHNHVAPDPGENWEGASGVPEATLTKGLLKEFQDQIERCTEPVMQRPPGKWQEEQRRKAEREAQKANGPPLKLGGMADLISSDEEEEAKGGAGQNELELWSTTKPTRDLQAKITHMENPSQQITLTISNELLVKQLKEAIVQKVGRGPASRIVLSTSGENTLADDMLLSSVEEEVEQGLMLMGVDLSEGAEMQVRIVHAASDTPQSLVVTVLDNATILDVRKAIKAKLEERLLQARAGAGQRLLEPQGRRHAQRQDGAALPGPRAARDGPGGQAGARARAGQGQEAGAQEGRAPEAGGQEGRAEGRGLPAQGAGV